MSVAIRRVAHDASRCEPVNVGVYRWFRGDLTQFLHNSKLHLLQYIATFLGTLQYVPLTRRSDVITLGRFSAQSGRGSQP
jgi:hypothetical protein